MGPDAMMATASCPAILVAAPASGQGKTTATAALATVSSTRSVTVASQAPASNHSSMPSAMSAASIGLPIGAGTGSCQIKSSSGTSGPR